MDNLKIIISGGKEHYGAWAKDVAGIYGAGDTLEAVKESIKESITLYTECNENVPKLFKSNLRLDFVFDICGMIKYYNQFISLPAMEKLTGINQKQLWHYANGYKIPRKGTSEKIEKGLKDFACKLSNEKIEI